MFIISSLAADEINCILAAYHASLIHSISICQMVLRTLGEDTEQNTQNLSPPGADILGGEQIWLHIYIKVTSIKEKNKAG